MENIIVIGIVGLAIFGIYRMFTNKNEGESFGNCGGECNGCNCEKNEQHFENSEK
jgi:hypothetical protein